MDIQSSDFIEKLIIKGLMGNKRYCSLVLSAFDSKLFENTSSAILFKEISQYFRTYKELPSNDILINLIPEKSIEEISEYIKEVDSIDFNYSTHLDFLIDETDKWIKESAIRNAILDSADLLASGKKDEYNKINKLIKDALCKSIKFDLGVDYFNSLGERLQRMFNTIENRVPSYYPTLDEYISGGFPRATLNVAFARTHGHKCVSYETEIEIKNIKTNKIETVKIGDFISNFIYNYACTHKYKHNKKDLFIKKYGEEKGFEIWKQWLKINQNKEKWKE